MTTMSLSEMHPQLAHAIDELVERAKGCGDTPGDVRAMVEMLVDERIASATGCGDCTKGVKHLHSFRPRIVN